MLNEPKKSMLWSLCTVVLSTLLIFSSCSKDKDESNPELKLEVSPETIVLDTYGNEKSFSFSVSGIWTVNTEAEWLELESIEKKVDGLAFVSVKVTAVVNELARERIATITVTGNGKSATVSVTQESGEGQLETLPETLLFPFSEESKTVEVTANCLWLVIFEAEWLTVTPNEGIDDGVLTITATQNESPDERTATVTVSGGGKTSSIVVTQAGRVYDVYQMMDDPNFIKYCKEQDFDKDGNDILTPEEAAAVTEIKVDNMNITSLAGIEYFVGLQKLYCNKNKLTELDLRANSALQELYCHDNLINALDISANNELKDLITYKNQITELDLSNNTKLVYLECSYNRLIALDVSANRDLKYLSCDANKLTTLELSNHAILETLACSYNQLKVLDLSSCPKLKWLDCANNGLISLNVNSCSELQGLVSNNNELTEINISNCINLLELSCNNNKLESLDISSNTKLTKLNAVVNKFTEVKVWEGFTNSDNYKVDTGVVFVN